MDEATKAALAALVAAAVNLANVAGVAVAVGQSTVGASGAGAGATQQGAGAQATLTPDIGTDEAYQINMKALVERHNSHDIEGANMWRHHSNAAATEYQTTVAKLNNAYLTAFDNANKTQDLNARKSIDNVWNHGSALASIVPAIVTATLSEIARRTEPKAA